MSPTRAQAVYDNRSISFTLPFDQTGESLRLSHSNYEATLASRARDLPERLRGVLDVLFSQKAIDRCELYPEMGIKFWVSSGDPNGAFLYPAGRLQRFIIAYSEAIGREIVCDWNVIPARADSSGASKRAALKEVAIDVFEMLGQPTEQIVIRLA